MTIAQVKSKLGIISLDLVQCFDENDAPTEWLRHWENDDRISVVMKQETADLIKSKLNRDDLSLFTEVKVSEPKKDVEKDVMIPGKEYLNCVVHIQEHHVISF